MKNFNGLKELANKIHRKFHRVIYGKNPTHEAEYYDTYVAYFDRRFDEIEKIVKKTQSDINNYIKKDIDENICLQEETEKTELNDS